ncbi:unnamed protein product [Triticum turgidum subsp. durum]|uniref:Uncharacterized protein n=1 Tax=Triticum turgidum subsp. durum TaxID=4567 RepID=A0A9R0RZN0_TRITD|nr:unnamed protein product [Triticum turgidum subsp. durum]
MAAYYNGGRTMPYSNTDECFDGGRTMYSNNTDDCYDAGKHGHGHGQGHGHGGANMYANTTDVECFQDSGRHGYGGGGRTMYSNTVDEECFDSGRHGHGHGHGYGHNDGRAMSYSTTTEECFGGGEQGQGYYKKEVKQHKNRERVGEVGALAAGAFALVINQLTSLNKSTLHGTILYM